MDTKKLRQKILDLAIRGKLVPQDPNDEPASLLLERIRAEKERLIKEGKIKRSKMTTVDNKTDAPFEIPESWEWVSIEDLLTNRDSERVPLSLTIRKKQRNKIYDYYGAAGVIDKVEGYLFSERLLLIGEDGANLLSRSKDNAFFAEGKYWVNNHAHVLDCCEKYILDYVAFVINSMSLEKYITGSAQPKLTQDNLNKIIIPLPPKEEQKRIINTIERWFSVIDELESNENDLLKAIDKAKSKILDLAIHGKLVPQDPNDEPASALMNRIREEKKRLVIEGKLKKKDLKETPINEDEKPFDIPDNWEWVRLKSIASKIVDGDHNPPQGLSSNSGFYMLSSKNIDNDSIIGLDDVRYLSFEDWKKCNDRTCLEKGDVLLTTVATLGRSCVYEDNVPYCFQRSVSIVHTFIFNYYLKYSFDSPYYQSLIDDKATGTAQRGFYLNQLEESIIPLPPLAEQKRIVAKIKEAFKVLDALS